MPQSQALEPIGVKIDGEVRAAQRLEVPDLPMWLGHVDLNGPSVSVIGQNLEVSGVALGTISDLTGLLDLRTDRKPSNRYASR